MIGNGVEVAQHCLFLKMSSLLVFIALSSISLAAETIKVGGTGAAMGTIRHLFAVFQKSHQETNIEIVLGLSSGGAKKALLQDALHIAVTSKAGKNAETIKEAVVAEYGSTPFVFATSRDNNTAGLTSLDILNIYSGKTTTWPDGKRLRLILRPAAVSDTDVLKSMSPAMALAIKTALSRESMKIAITDQDSADAIESIPGALGSQMRPRQPGPGLPPQN